ncbi:hypothetical protein [Candidatus Endolissoclinum faulkneri]|uniref:hypothetical protein n=1 Tax=Candidatus Endolissoclinum faulkneri TaxID=1263979 RepID=UPI0004017A95|nr:hypothetical protein [Candidatus Endolissoclinum faulkneri]
MSLYILGIAHTSYWHSPTRLEMPVAYSFLFTVLICMSAWYSILFAETLFEFGT